jgi:hypothetical protein
MAKVTAERLREVLDYCPESGVFRWRRVTKGNQVKVGAVAGCQGKKGQRRVIQIEGRLYYAAPLAYLYMTGEWAPNDIDHRNSDPSDNRWLNLHPATRSQNMANTRAHTDSRTSVKGVFLHKETGKWRARIRIESRSLSLGLFHTIEEAAAAYDKAALERWGEFARLNGPVQSSALLPDDGRIQMCRWLAQVKRCKRRVDGDPRAGKLADAIIDAAEQLLALGVERRAVVAREDTP